ncbi:hypothetical protein BSN82_17830, partial [Acinetobacter baylyi]|uniref:hypothetical protein n=1 Tax=Acinetobacter baylyi TaxID=202950 RepID=UPI0013D6DFBC
ALQISQLYSVDYDLGQKVHRASVDEMVRGLQSIIRNLLDTPGITIGDFKCGVKLDWYVIPEIAHIKHGKIVGYDKNAAIRNVKALHEVLTEQEKQEAISLLKKSDSVAGFLEAKQSIRPHLVRWTPKEILRGYVTLRTGERYTLADGIQSPSMCKLDVVAYVDGSYTDFSIIYYFFCGNKQLNKADSDPVLDISQNLLYYYSQGNYFKALKRLYSLAKLNTDTTLLGKLQPILNSDLGILYSVLGDLQTLQYLLDICRA